MQNNNIKKNSFLKSAAIMTMVLAAVMTVNATSLGDSLSTFTSRVLFQPDSSETAMTVNGNGDVDNLVLTSSATTQEGAWIYSNTARSGGTVLLVQDDHASTTSNTMKVLSDGTGKTLVLDTNGNTVSLDIDSESTTNHAFTADVNAGKSIFRLGSYTSSTGTYYLERNVPAATSTGPVASIVQKNASDDQPVLNLQQVGSGSHVSFTGSVASCPASGNHLISNTTGIYACVSGTPTKLN